MKRGFSERVLRLTEEIPKGRVTTYSEIARYLGSPKACRAVGNALNKNAFPERIPCYRVVHSNGSVGGFALGQAEKIRRLERDGIHVINGKLDLEKHFHSFIKSRG
jgi:O-6-methylguanine DNA methyltransferase